VIKIHKEGRRILFVTLLVLLALNLLLNRYNGPNVVFNRIFAGASVIAFLTLLQFFRSPFRRLLTHEDLLLAPADGKVVVIEEVYESEYFEDARRQISVFMSPINVHITRNPVSGIVESDAGPLVLFRQIAGAMARRIVWYVNEGDEVSQGEEFGFIKFGSRVDVFVPLDADIKVTLGQKVKGGETVLCQFKG
jgi:phosphatidylserine decarboxylase